MCGRFTLSIAAEALAQTFHVQIPDFEPQYNIAQTQMVLAVLYNPETKKRTLKQLRSLLDSLMGKRSRDGGKAN